MSAYFRPIVQVGSKRPASALCLAGGQGWFTHVERMARGQPPVILPAENMSGRWYERLTSPRPTLAGLDLNTPKLMGILNVTPDSFSDGGVHESLENALAHAQRMVDDGANIIDVGGESTRPGAEEVDPETEISRTVPVIGAIRASKLNVPISIDTRKAVVATAAEADLINDVSGFTFDPDLTSVAAQTQSPVCVMHTQGTPDVMQDAPNYEDVVLDVFDWLESRIDALEASGIPRTRILADPGIGFGKTFEHNVELLKSISLFHGLGAGILLGVSRKGFIGRIGQEPVAERRAPGSIAVAIHAAQQGAQVFRVHDVKEHAQALALWQSCVA